MEALPALTDHPKRHVHCCLSLSRKLLDLVCEILVSSLSEAAASSRKTLETEKGCKGTSESGGAVTVLSVGSGTGLLEALLNRHVSHLQSATPRTSVGKDGSGQVADVAIEGVEVGGTLSLNRYLLENRKSTVLTTGEVSKRLKPHEEDVRGLMFVYPRQGELLRRYVEAVLDGWEGRQAGGVAVVVVMGPLMDLDDFEECFDPLTRLGMQMREVSGGAAGLEEGEGIRWWTW